MQSYPSHPSKVPPFSADAEKWLNKSLGFGEYSPYVGGGGNIPGALNFKKSAYVKNLKYSRWIPLNQAKINALWNVFSLTSELRSIGNFSNIVDFSHLRQSTLWNSTFWQILVCTVLFEIISHWASLDRSISHAEGKAISLSCAKLGFGHFFSTGWLLKTNYLSDNIMGLEKVMRENWQIITLIGILHT